jgi:hypothetical protein
MGTRARKPIGQVVLVAFAAEILHADGAMASFHRCRGRFPFWR